MTKIINLIKRELKKVVKDSNLMMIFIVAPLAYPLLYGAIYLHKIEENIPIAVIDYDNSHLSRQFIRDLDAHQNLEVNKVISDDADIKSLMAHENIQAALYLPKNFSADLKYGKQINLKLVISPGRLLVLSDVGFPISAIASTFGGKVMASYLMKKGVPITQNPLLVTPVKFDFQNMYNPYLTYGDLILPPLLIIIFSQIIVIGAAAATAKESQLSNWKELFDISNNAIIILISKIITYIFVFSIHAMIAYFIIAPIYEINYFGSALDLLFIFICGSLASIAFGLFVGTFFKHRISVFVILGFTSYPFFMISGYAWPQAQIPDYIVSFSKLFPLVPFLKAVFNSSQMQNNMDMIMNQINNMLILFIGYSGLFTLRIMQLRKKQQPIKVNGD